MPSFFYSYANVFALYKANKRKPIDNISGKIAILNICGKSPKHIKDTVKHDATT